MKKMLSFLLLALTLFLPSASWAAQGDIFAIPESGKDVFRVKGVGGAIFTSSGISSEVPLWGFSYDLVDLPLASTAGVRGPNVVSTGTLLNGTTALIAADLTQSPIPRGLNIFVQGASGTVQVQGYSGLGALQTEIVSYTSGTAAQTLYPYAFISSITFAATSVNNLNFGATYWIGVSSRIALPNQVVEATAVYKVTENQVVRSTYNVVPGSVSAIDIPSVTATNDYKIWMWIRKTLLVP